MKAIIETQQAPQAIGCYSQAVRMHDTIYVSGQLGIDPATGHRIDDDFAAECRQAFTNLTNVFSAADCDFSHVVKLTIYLTNMNNFAIVNEVMAEFCDAPYPARACVAVAALPKQAAIEIDAILMI